MLAGLATDYLFLLVARIIQAAGGAAVPGLGMTLVSRAYGPESRGMVLGIIAAPLALAQRLGLCWDDCFQNCLAGGQYFSLPPERC